MKAVPKETTVKRIVTISNKMHYILEKKKKKRKRKLDCVNETIEILDFVLIL